MISKEFASGDTISMNQDFLSSLAYPKTALRDGKLVLPDSVSYVRIDVGLSTHASHSAWFLDMHKDRGSIGIEPDPRCCEELIHGSDLYPDVKRLIINKQIIRHNNSDICSLNSRFILVNCAISDVDIPTHLPFYLTDAQLAGDRNQYKVFGTSSLHIPTKSHPSGGYIVTDVIALPLRAIIMAIPDRFKFIEEIKIDTEGHDYQVIKSAGECIKKAVYVTVESGSNAAMHHKGILVDSQNSTRSIIQNYMAAMGFKVDFEDATDQRYLNVRLKHLVKMHGLNTNGDPMILEGKSSPVKRRIIMAKRSAKKAIRKFSPVEKTEMPKERLLY